MSGRLRLVLALGGGTGAAQTRALGNRASGVASANAGERFVLAGALRTRRIDQRLSPIGARWLSTTPSTQAPSKPTGAAGGSTKPPPKNERFTTYEFRTSKESRPNPAASKTTPPPPKAPARPGGGYGKQAEPAQKNDDVESSRYRINAEITGVVEAVCVAPSGTLGKISFARIQEEAAKLKLDMVEVAKVPNVVIKLMDFNAFVEEKRALRKQREALMGTQPKALEEILPPLKEIQVGTNIEHHDFEMKKEHMRKFLEKGHPVKLVIKLKKSRTTAKNTSDSRPQKANELIERVIADLSDYIAVDKIKNDPKPMMGTVVKFFYPKKLPEEKASNKAKAGATPVQAPPSTVNAKAPSQAWQPSSEKAPSPAFGRDGEALRSKTSTPSTGSNQQQRRTLASLTTL